jgi:hypothetical protein
MIPTRYGLLLVASLVAALPGCRAGRTRETVTFAVVANVLVVSGPAAEPPGRAAVDTALDRLKRTIREINASENVRFAVFLGNLIGDGRGRSIDRVTKALGELRKPYYVVLGHEGLGDPVAGDSADSAAGTVGTSFIVWRFQGHGFNSPQPYWATDVGGGLVLLALHTAGQGPEKAGHVDAEQLQWLDRTLVEHRDQAVAVLSYHALIPQHAFDNTVVWRHHMVDNADEVLGVLARHQNIAMVLSASHGIATGKTGGNAVHLREPALSVWPLAYDVVRIGPSTIERQVVSAGTDSELRTAMDRLLADPTTRQILGESERELEQAVTLFGGRKTQLWNLSTMKP